MLIKLLHNRIHVVLINWVVVIADCSV
jgi:hypothetical protein